MALERSCGILVVRDAGEGRELLLIQSSKGGHWSFPKGHMEPGETEEQTARREVWEETGLRVDPVPQPRFTTGYRLMNGNTKEVTYFAGLWQGGEARPQQEELEGLGWFPLESAADVITYENDREILRALMDTLRSLPGSEG